MPRARSGIPFRGWIILAAGYDQFGALEQVASGHGLGELARQALGQAGASS
ncbi:MAG TPA: hypothetical protein VHA70_13665 [Bauldia sp.]|nr:hypothetical protein [Bauldia sp.]